MQIADDSGHVTEPMTPSAAMLLEALLSQSSVGLAFFDRDLRFVHLNETLARINGVPVASHRGRPLREIVPSLVAAVEAITAEIGRTGRPVAKEIRGETRAQPGVMRTWHEHWFPVLDEAGTLTGFGVLVEETTERTDAIAARDALIEALRTSEDRLRSSEERLRLSMEAAYLIGFSWDIPRDEVHRLHSASSALPATDPAQPMRLADVLARVFPDDRRHFKARIDAALADPAGRYESEFRVVEADGQIRWLYERGSVARGADGTPQSLSGLSQDITARKSAEQALLEANRRKDEFLATLAHELRNPLAPIRSATEILRLSDVPAATRERAVDIIDRQVTQMVRLVDDLLDVNRITRGDIALQQETLDFTRIVHAAIETSRPLIEGAQHELQLSLPFAPALVWGDAARLSQALSNLLNNAARYTPAGGRIAIEVVRERGRVRVCVNDNGRGIPPSRLHDVFEMFTRISPAEGHTGLGIGLALVKRIVRLHGGEIRAHSDGEGTGTTFELWLPFVGADTGTASPMRQPIGEHEASSPTAEATPAHSPDRALRILIVDDNVDFAASEATMLELRHHIVCVVHDAEEALQVVKVFSPDVALLDIGLPGMSGYELAQQLRADPEHADLVLIAQTGWGQPRDRDKALTMGFDAHLTKPVEWEKLARVLVTLVPSEKAP